MANVVSDKRSKSHKVTVFTPTRTQQYVVTNTELIRPAFDATRLCQVVELVTTLYNVPDYTSAQDLDLSNMCLDTGTRRRTLDTLTHCRGPGKDDNVHYVRPKHFVHGCLFKSQVR